MNIEEILLENGYEGTKFFPEYNDAVIGISSNGEVIYDFDKMIDCLMRNEDWSYESAVEWIEYNTIRALPYMQPGAPIVSYNIESYL